MHELSQPLNQLKGFIAQAVDLAFPTQCIACNAIGYLFCPTCAQLVKPTNFSVCSQCKRFISKDQKSCLFCQNEASTALIFVHAAALYLNPLPVAIHALKYQNQQELGPILARYLISVFQRPPWTLFTNPPEFVIPVPLHPQRLEERGYNQSELLASEFCSAVGLQLEPGLLFRVRNTVSQVGLNAEDRRLNMTDAFRAESRVVGRNILLIDDVFTTGATLRACATTLHKAGAKYIYAITLATPSSEET
ncbi:ComF family protein [Chloroflexi bacterium TSY]|nr:ComF family protein [Chloroflexi bacterium TSY]